MKEKYQVMQDGGVPIKSWTVGVPFEDEARRQLLNISKMPFIHQWIAAMPDVHLGKGATIGSVVPTLGAVIPAAVGVDIGCGMMAVRSEMTPAGCRTIWQVFARPSSRQCPTAVPGEFAGVATRGPGGICRTM